MKPHVHLGVIKCPDLKLLLSYVQVPDPRYMPVFSVSKLAAVHPVVAPAEVLVALFLEALLDARPVRDARCIAVANETSALAALAEAARSRPAAEIPLVGPSSSGFLV
ncbi:hypothetical protein DVH05_006772 [Phytophthora capsici]|nr:hypothetical protein DVH05_006772 [Phytophthora capsici]